MKILALIIDTFREIYAKKVILAIVSVEVVALVITGLILFSDGMQLSFRESEELSSTAGRVDSSEVAALPDARHPRSDSAVMEDSLLLGGDTSLQEGMPMPSTRDTTRGSRTLSTPHGIGGTDTGAAAGLRAGSEVMLEEKVIGPLTLYAVAIFAATLFMGMFATAGIVPSMMEKGTIDLLLSKPLSRTGILFGRVLGGWSAVLINLIFFVGSVWALYGMASGEWHTPFLTGTVAVCMFGYLVVYCGVLMMNVITESWILPLIIAYAHVIILSPFLTERQTEIFGFIESPFLRSLIDGLYYILPQTGDLMQQGIRDAVLGGHIMTWAPFVQGLIFAAVTATVAVWRFNRKDF